MAKSQSFNGELLHFGSIRLRIVGSGTLVQQLQSLDNETSETLPSLTMASTTGREPTILASFISQRACLKISVDAINEWFNISKITIYVRPIASGYPQ